MSDAQTPESRESLTIEQQINRIVIHYTEEHGVGVAATTKDLYPTFTQPMLELVTAAVQQSNRELLLNYDAMFQELINCYGYEKAKAIKDGIEIHES